MDPQPGPAQPDLLIGQTIGNYLVTQKLGEGGMGAVYLAEHPSIGKKVALKVLHPEFSTNQEVAARFFHEAKAVNDIGHPNIVDIIDFGMIQAVGGRERLVYFIMEYLAGMTLAQLIRSEAPLPSERALSIAMQVADALGASHKCGIVHRDLKPDNIILVQRGREREFVKLLDFGIAKLIGGSAAGSQRTREGMVLGTPAYMSPEQCEGLDTVDLRTDIYALGIVIYEMLTGRVPFLGDSYGQILVQHLTQPPVPPSQFRMLPAHVEVVVMKALEKRADLRYPTMEEFMRAMADPVGYVEASGGVSGFLQRQLMPSSAPLPPVRLTPAPFTPPPGTLVAPGVPPGQPPSQPPSGPAIAALAPTTLGSAAGQVHASRGKVGYVLAGMGIVAVAVALIIILAGKDRVQPAGGGSSIAGDDRGSGPGSAAMAGTTARGSGSTTPGSGGERIAADNATGPGSGETGSGSGTVGSGGAMGTEGPGGPAGGSTGSAQAQAGPEPGHTATGPTIAGDPESEIHVISTPARARIYLDDVDTREHTPATLKVPRTAKSISITLKLKGYAPFTFESVDAGESSRQEAELVKLKTGGARGRCRTPERPRCVRDARGCCEPEGSGSRRNHHGNKAGSAAQNSDPDGLIRP